MERKIAFIHVHATNSHGSMFFLYSLNSILLGLTEFHLVLGTVVNAILDIVRLTTILTQPRLSSIYSLITNSLMLVEDVILKQKRTLSTQTGINHSHESVSDYYLQLFSLTKKIDS